MASRDIRADAVAVTICNTTASALMFLCSYVLMFAALAVAKLCYYIMCGVIFVRNLVRYACWWGDLCLAEACRGLSVGS